MASQVCPDTPNLYASGRFPTVFGRAVLGPGTPKHQPPRLTELIGPHASQTNETWAQQAVPIAQNTEILTYPWTTLSREPLRPTTILPCARVVRRGGLVLHYPTLINCVPEVPH
jgi:hypothetical protein